MVEIAEFRRTTPYIIRAAAIRRVTGMRAHPATPESMNDPRNPTARPSVDDAYSEQGPNVGSDHALHRVVRLIRRSE